jgi:hypothetical protein
MEATLGLWALARAASGGCGPASSRLSRFDRAAAEIDSIDGLAVWQSLPCIASSAAYKKITTVQYAVT